jgi:hypothetical protein
MSTNLSEVQQRTGVVPQQVLSTLSVESDRAIAQVRTAYEVAKRFPRDMNAAVARIKGFCQVLEVAMNSEYSYKRGGQLVQDANIRIAEIVANNWSNLEYGTAELMRAEGESLCEAYCTDLETNTKRRIQFVVPHRRDKTEGGADLKSDRDIREMINNIGARSVREMIFAIVPHFVVDAAIDECRKTVKKADAKEPLKERIKKLVPAFVDIGVTVPMLTKWLKCQPEEMVELQFQQLRRIFPSIRDHAMRKEDFFEPETTPQAQIVKPSNDPAAGAEDADNQIPHEDPKKIVPKEDLKKAAADVKAEEEAKKPAPETNPPAAGPPGFDEIVASCKAATDPEKLVELMSLTNGNKALTKDQVRELRKQITDRMAAVSAVE